MLRGICTRRAGKLYKARSRLYRSQILQVNTHVKALAEIYIIHSFAPLGVEVEKKGKHTVDPKKPTTKKMGKKKRENRNSRKQKKNYLVLQREGAAEKNQQNED